MPTSIKSKAELLKKAGYIPEQNGGLITREWMKAIKIATEKQATTAVELVRAKMEQVALQAIERLPELVSSDNEQVATVNTHFAINHTIGKPVQRTENKTLQVNIDILAD